MNNILTYDRLKISCPYPLQYITQLEISSRLNEHSRILVTGVLREEEQDQCIRTATAQDAIQVYETGAGTANGKDALIFAGIVTHLSVNVAAGVYTIEIEGLSYTHLLDIEVKSRSFQDENAGYAAVIAQILSDYDDASFIQIPDDRPTGGLLVQYQETDWEFIRRLATHFNTLLIPQDLGTGPRFWLGVRQNTKDIALEHEANVRVKTDEDGYYKASAQGFNVRRAYFVKYGLESGTRLILGERLTFQGKPCIVERADASFSKGLFRYQYLLGQEGSLLQAKRHNPQLQGVSLLGSVLDTRDSAVQLHLRLDAEQKNDPACWLPYAPPSNNLFYCMPETGENASLYFPTADEKSAIVINSVRRNGGSCSKTSKPDTKYLSIPSGQEIKLSKKDVAFSHNEGVSITLDAAQGILVHSREDLTILSQRSLTLEAKEKIKMSANTGDIIIGSGANASLSQLLLMSGVNGDTHIYAANKLLEDGRYRERFPDRLNQAIVYKEKAEEKFSWLQLAACVVAAVAVVALVVVTAGAAAVVLGAAAATVNAVMAGAAISGGIAIATMAAGDILSGQNRTIEDYVNGAFRAAVEGAVCGAVQAVMAPLQGMAFLSKLTANQRLFAKACLSGLTGAVTDSVMQLPDIVRGQAYDGKRTLTAFATAFGMTYAAAGLNVLVKKATGSPNSGLCILSRDPVDVVNGVMISDATDFELPGPLPLIWRRTWYSDSSLIGHLGHGSRCSWEMGMEVFEGGQSAVYLADGRVGVFPPLLPGEEHFNYKESLLLHRESDHYRLFDPASRYTYHFHPSEGGYMTYKLTAIRNAQGQQIEVRYNPQGYLSRIIDSAGRILEIKTNPDGRIEEIAIGKHILLQYRYKNDDLCEVIDAAGLSTHLDYSDHLLGQRTDRDKGCFHWRYNRGESVPRVRETWGDGAELLGRFTYHDDSHYTALEDSRKNRTAYHYDERKLCTRIVYQDKTETRREYNERYQLVREIDEEGRVTAYTYNQWSQPSKITRPDGNTIEYAYDEAGRLTAETDPDGTERHWLYNDDDTLRQSIDKAGRETYYTYNENKLPAAIRNHQGDTLTLDYDPDGNLTKLTLPDGAATGWEYDRLGNCLSTVNPQGASERYCYDKLSRLVKAELPDGNVIELRYNGYQDVLHAQDKHSEVSYTYTLLGQLKTRKQGKRQTTYQYDQEGQLTAVVNKRTNISRDWEEAYKIERDLKGNISKEIGFDGVSRSYERDASGRLKRISRPDGRYTSYQQDKNGNITRIDYHDKTWETFAYNKNGELTEAKSGQGGAEHVTVKLERDAAGQLIKEWQIIKDEQSIPRRHSAKAKQQEAEQQGNWIASAYDDLGNRQRISSSLGANILTARDPLGRVTHLAASQAGQPAWAAIRQYNELGQEIERLLPGGVVNRWQYDTIGRPTHHHVQTRERDTRRRGYTWGVNAQIKSVIDELRTDAKLYGYVDPNHGITAYRYDEMNNLVSAETRRRRFTYRSADEVGNIYETEDNSDRIYKAGSRLEQAGVNTNELKNIYQGGKGKLVTKGTEFAYDVEGNLSQKTEKNGDVWRYEYYGNGMLSKVVRTDGGEVTFRYDALGRRVEKKTSETTKRFLWDGNRPLHEWEEDNGNDKDKDRDRDITTWVFDDGFVPMAKLTNAENYGVVTDHIGTPVEAFDAKGERIWSAELDIYGRVKEFTGEENFIPFRYQGQYADPETGLYYNRFRYYDPSIGQYTQQDPIGLAGGNPTLYGYVSNPNIELDIFGLWSLFRAIFGNEIIDVLTTNIVKNVPGGYETGKLFATTYNDAVRYGELLSQFESNPNFKILEVDVPNGLTVTEQTMDRMRAVLVDNADLDKLEVKGCK